MAPLAIILLSHDKNEVFSDKLCLKVTLQARDNMRITSYGLKTILIHCTSLVSSPEYLGNLNFSAHPHNSLIFVPLSRVRLRLLLLEGNHGYNCDREGSSRRGAKFERCVHTLVVPSLFDHLSHTVTIYYPPPILLSVSLPPRTRGDRCPLVSCE